MSLFYADASALVKLIQHEPESGALQAFLTDAELVSCELVQVVALLFNVSDIAASLAHIERLVEEDDGQEGDEG